VTVDEFAHLPAGLYYLQTGHFDVYNLSPPLLRELAALPVLAAGPAGDFARFTTFPEHWALGYEFMERNRDRYHLLFVLGRLPMVALALALVVAVYLCGARHLGTRAGLAAAALAAFCPTVLAHGYLAHGSGTPLAAYTLKSPGLRALAQGPLGALPLPLPADFVRGFDKQRAEATSYYTVYFHGEWSTRGWWYYYPAAFALKETLPMLVLLAAGLLALAAGRATRDRLFV